MAARVPTTEETQQAQPDENKESPEQAVRHSALTGRSMLQSSKFARHTGASRGKDG